MRRALCGSLGVARDCARDAPARSVTVLAWGRNSEGQCGVPEQQLLVLQPTEVTALAGVKVSSLVAGRVSSAAVTAAGEVLTWGCGQAGKLGHGDASNVRVPSRVEWLAHRATVRAVALGDGHTLFLDAEAHVWSVGENKEGQCGLGTPIGELAAQHRLQWGIGALTSVWQQQPTPRIAAAGLQQAAAGGSGGRGGGAGRLAPQAAGWVAPPFAARVSREAEVAAASALAARGAPAAAPAGQPWAHHPRSDAAAAASGTSAGLPGLDVGALSCGLMPGQLQLPTRIACGGPLSDSAAPPSALEEPGGIGGVASIAASRYFSLMQAADGSVWSCGGGFNGELGLASGSWVTSAAPVEGRVQQLIADNGGSVKLAAGATFSASLTASGAVVVWGWVPAGPDGSAPRRDVLVLPGLPPITDIAAGRSHLVMTDGESVWALGRWTADDSGRHVGCGLGEPPFLRRPAVGVAAVAAGSQMAAALSNDGEVVAWGQLVARQQAAALAGAGALDQWAPALACGEPTTIMTGVRTLAMGGAHALVILR